MGTRRIKRNSESLDESFLPSKKGRRKGKGPKSTSTKKSSLSLPRFSRAQVGYTALGVVLFMLILVSKVPFNRLGGKALQNISRTTNMDIDAGEMDISLLFGPRVIFTDLVIRTRSRSSGRRQKRSKFMDALSSDGIKIDRLVFRPSIIQLIQSQFTKGSTPGGSFSAEAFGGEIDGSFSMIGRLNAEISAEDVSLAKIPALSRAFRASGIIEELELDVSALRARMGNATGELNLKANNLQIDASAISSDSLFQDLGVLNLGNLSINGQSKNGRLRLTDSSLKGKKTDLEAELEGELRLNDRIDRTDMDLIVRLTPGSKLAPLFGFVGASLLKKDSSGTYSGKLGGSLAVPKLSPL